MKKAVFVIATQYDNLGDLIINKCLIDALSTHVELYVDTKNISDDFKEVILSNNKLKTLEKSLAISFKDYRIFRMCYSKNIVFDYYFKSPGPITAQKLPFLTALKSQIYTFLLAVIKPKLGKAYIIGSEINFENNDQVNSFIRKSGFYEGFYLRSLTNVADLSTHNIPNLHYIPDLCFLMRDEINVRQNINRREIGISFRELQGSGLNENIQRSVEESVAFYSDMDYKITFFHQVERDANYTRQLYSRFSDRPNVQLIESPLTYGDIILYENFETVISNRLHVLLLGFVNNSIALPVIDDNTKTNKIKGIFESIGSPILPYEVLTKENLEAVHEQIGEHKRRIEEINEVQYNLCKNTLASLFVKEDQ